MEQLWEKPKMTKIEGKEVKREEHLHPGVGTVQQQVSYGSNNNGRPRVCVCVCGRRDLMGFPAQKKTRRCAHVHPHTVDIDPAVGRRLLHQSARTHPGVFYCSTEQTAVTVAMGVGGAHGNTLRLECVKNGPVRAAHKY